MGEKCTDSRQVPLTRGIVERNASAGVVASLEISVGFDQHLDDGNRIVGESVLWTQTF